MYSKQQASLIRQQFWTAFGMYMQPVPSAEGEKINWVNYKTGIKDVSFKMQAIGDRAFVAVELTHKDPAEQQIYFDKFRQFKSAFQEIVSENWQWHLHVVGEHGKMISLIYKQLDNVNVLNKNHWPQLISFFKPRIVALDQFWSAYKYGFEE